MHSGRTDRSTPDRSQKPPTDPSGGATPDGLPRSWWLALALLAVIAVGLLAWRLLPPVDPERALVERFGRLLDQDRAAALRLLGPPAVFGPDPVTEAEAEENASDYFLRQEGLRVVEVLPGVPDGQGKQRPLPRHWTLVTRSNGSTPLQRIRGRDGVSAPRSMTLTNPDIVIEVREGVLIPLRTELPLR